MSTLTPLVPQAQPALRRAPAAATVGATWRWIVTVTNDGAAFDLTGCTGTCQVVDSTGTVLISPTVTFGVGSFTISADEATTAALGIDRRTQCHWSLTVTDGTEVVQFWGVSDSPFTILPAN